MSTPTTRTLALLRERGVRAGIVEKWNPHARVRQDLFGFIDIVALDDDRGIVGIQCTAGSAHAARRTKIQTEMREPALAWLACGGFIEIWSWSKNKGGKRGGRTMWRPRIERVTVADILGGTDEEETS